ncbi:hypothetical protein NSERUTF1_3239 [Nocardia seriolae]|nr:hypothetical protein NSERUTF1_3239 [Nocardia seriolae]
MPWWSWEPPAARARPAVPKAVAAGRATESSGERSSWGARRSSGPESPAASTA